MTKVEIYDPAMCCDTGVCGSVVDPELTELAAAVHSLEKKGFEIKRFNLANDPGAFVENKLVNEVLYGKGVDALPVIMLDGQIQKIGSYPAAAELAEWFKVDENELAVKKPSIPLMVKAVPAQGAK